MTRLVVVPREVSAWPRSSRCVRLGALVEESGGAVGVGGVLGIGGARPSAAQVEEVDPTALVGRDRPAPAPAELAHRADLPRGGAHKVHGRLMGPAAEAEAPRGIRHEQRNGGQNAEREQGKAHGRL